MNVGILTISDRSARGEYEDRSGPVLRGIVTEQTGWNVTEQSVIADDYETIVSTLLRWSTEADVQLILTTGGTGFAPRDVTPEATKAVIEREAPGIAEALRAESLRITRHAMLSRAVAGIRERCLIINLPGSPRAVRENMMVLLPVLPHALALLTERPESGAGHRTV